MVVDQVLVAELATFAVFEPFLGGLVATDVEIPGEFRHIAEVLGLVDPDLFIVVLDATHKKSPATGKVVSYSSINGDFNKCNSLHSVPSGTRR